MAITRGQLRQEFSAQAVGWDVPEEVQFPEFDDLDWEGLYPSQTNIFRAFNLLKQNDVRYVILGQDPYYQNGLNGHPIATGVAFGVADLGNIRNSSDARSLYSVLKGIYGNDRDRFAKSDLEQWAKCKGILLLNAALTVPAQRDDEPRAAVGQHLPKWRQFTESIIRSLPEDNVTLVAWGKPASNLVSDIAPNRNNIWRCNHPVARSGHMQSFSQFWANEGKELTCHCNDSTDSAG